MAPFQVITPNSENGKAIVAVAQRHDVSPALLAAWAVSTQRRGVDGLTELARWIHIFPMAAEMWPGIGEKLSALREAGFSAQPLGVPLAWRPEKLISGCQTGADRAGLDVGMELGIPVGGNVPAGFRSEEPDGIPALYRPFLTETRSSGYPARTRLNIAQSDATMLFFTEWTLDQGSKLTMDLCASTYEKLLIPIRFDSEFNADVWLLSAVSMLNQRQPKTLNIAGNRESRVPGIYDATRQFLRRLWM